MRTLIFQNYVKQTSFMHFHFHVWQDKSELPVHKVHFSNIFVANEPDIIFTIFLNYVKQTSFSFRILLLLSLIR